MSRYIHNSISKSFRFGFTIVELLIVIVVIGILATVTVVAYNGIQERASATLLKSDLINSSKQIKLFQVDNGDYPTTIDCGQADSATNKCLKPSPGVAYQYVVNNTTPKVFCLTATKGSGNYGISQDGVPLGGSCPFMRLDAGNTASYTGAGATWNDISGNANNATLVNGTGYSAAGGGSLSFDGVDDRAEAAVQTYGNNMTWTAWVYCTQSVNIYNMFMGRHLPYFGFRNGNSLIFSNQIGGSQRTITSSANLALNTWYYTTFTTEYNGANTTMKVYVNGSLVTSGEWAGAQTNPSYKFTVGDGHEPTWYPFKGMVSDVAIYNKTMSASEVQQNFETLKGRYGL